MIIKLCNTLPLFTAEKLYSVYNRIYSKLRNRYAIRAAFAEQFGDSACNQA